MIPIDIVSVQLKHLNLGDLRLNKRMRKSFTKILEVGANHSFPNIFKDQFDLKGFYRLMNNMKVTPEGLYESYQKGLIELVQSHQELPEYNRLYCFSDTTFGKYNNRKGLQLGYIEYPTDNGCVIHSAVLTDKNFVPLGLASQEIIVRDLVNYGKRHERHQRKFEEKESFKWVKPIAFTEKLTQQTVAQVIHVMDREADIAEVFNTAIARNQFVLIRVKHNRTIVNEDILLKESLRQQSDYHKVTRQLLDAKGKAHEVWCEVRYAKIETKKINAPLWVIYLKAVAPVDEKSTILEELEELEWFMATNSPVDNNNIADELVDAYTHRWRTTEDFHKCLKTGCSIEKRQFEDLKSISNVIAMLSLVAIYLLRMRHLAQTNPDANVDQILDTTSVKLANVLAQKHLKPIDFKFCKSNTTLWLVLLIGRLGGHQGIKQKGIPGWQTLFKGWKYFQTLLHGINLSKNFFNET